MTPFASPKSISVLSAKYSSFSMPAKPGIHRTLDGEHDLRLVGVDDGHAEDRAVLVEPRRRIDDVVGADDERHVAARHLGVDVVHLDQPVVGNLRFGQQHVHVAGHAAGDRMDGELHVDAALRQLLVEIVHPVLRLRDGHAVSGNDDDR